MNNKIKTLKSKGKSDILLLKANHIGDFIWYNRIGSPENDMIFHFSQDNNGNSYTYAKINDSLTVSDSILFNKTNNYYSQISFDKNGQLLKGYSIANHFGNWLTSNESEYGYVFYPSRHSNELIASGFFTDSVRFYNNSDSITLKSVGNADAFVTRMILQKQTIPNCKYSIKESDTTICPSTSLQLNAIQTSASKNIIPQDGLIGYWPFNGNANDESGNGNHGVIDGAISSTDRCGKANKAFYFNGTDSKILIHDSPNLRPKSITCSAWIYCNNTQGMQQILAKNAGESVHESIDMVINNSNGYNFMCNIGGPDYYGNWLPSPDKVNDSSWQYMTFVFDSDNNKISSYIDGTKVAESVELAEIIYDSLPWSIGTEREYGSWAWHFKGKIDDLAIWNRPLTSLEIMQAYQEYNCGCIDTLPHDSFTWSTGQKGRTISVKPDTSTTYILTVTDGTVIHSDSIRVTVGGDSCISCTYAIREQDTTICQGTELQLHADLFDKNITDIPKNGLIGYWPFNGNSNDESGNGNHGIVDKATLTSDKNNKPNSAYKFYKSGSKIVVPDAQNLNNPFVSMSFWIKTKDSTLQSYIYKAKEGSAFNEEFAIYSNYSKQNTLEFSVKNGSNCQPLSGWNRNSTNKIVFDDYWHHIAASYDGIYSRVYIDTMLVSEIQNPYFPIDSCPGGEILFGKGWDNNANFDGILDDIAIWNRAITVDEVKSMYKISKSTMKNGIPQDGLIGYWPFSGNASDASGNSNHGVVSNAILTEDRCGVKNSAYKFNGSNSYIKTNRVALDSFSFSLWTKINSFTSLTPLIDAYKENWEIMTTQSKPTFVQWMKSNDTYNLLRSSDSIKTNTWVNISGTYKDSSITIFLNGKQILHNSNADLHIKSDGSFFFGYSKSGTDQFLNGDMDDIAIWNRALSESEILEVYNAGSCDCLDTLSEEKFLWSTGEIGRTIAVKPDKSTMYTLEVERGKIIDRDTIHVNVLESPTPDIFGHVKVYERQVNYSYYTPFNDSSTYEWSITGNGKLSSTNGGSSILVDFKEPGYAYLTVTETNKYGCKKDTTIIIKIYGLTEVSEHEKYSERLHIYPNPIIESNSVQVNAFIPPTSKTYISMVDLLGKELQSINVDGQDSFHEISVPMSIEGISNGVYLIQLHVNGDIVSKKLIINR